uniref:Lipocalin n=1 Tax=Rhipicephalus appendiculatus TaxID=34631 RepID=A0A131YUD4_RHIAP
MCFQKAEFKMTWTGTSLLFVLPYLCLTHAENALRKNDSTVPFEENEDYFCYQNASDAVNITEKLYVIIQNFENPKLPPECDSAQRVDKLNDTVYNFTLAAVIPGVPNITVKFTTPLVLSKTGNHTEYNAMTYKYATFFPAKLRKLMYLSPKRDCMIFVENRNWTDEAKCQLLQPATYADDGIPGECINVYNQYCPGRNVTVYSPICKNLTAIDVVKIMNRTTTAAPEQC